MQCAWYRQTHCLAYVVNRASSLYNTFARRSSSDDRWDSGMLRNGEPSPDSQSQNCIKRCHEKNKKKPTSLFRIPRLHENAWQHARTHNTTQHNTHTTSSLHNMQDIDSFPTRISVLNKIQDHESLAKTNLPTLPMFKPNAQALVHMPMFSHLHLCKAENAPSKMMSYNV